MLRSEMITSAAVVSPQLHICVQVRESLRIVGNGHIAFASVDIEKNMTMRVNWPFLCALPRIQFWKARKDLL